MSKRKNIFTLISALAAVGVITLCFLVFTTRMPTDKSIYNSPKAVSNTLVVDDPIIEKTLRLAESSGTVSDAEIRGYLLDWIDPSAGGIVELAVMKNGDVFRVGHRPSAAFGNVPPKRLKPESASEKQARLKATAAAQKVIDTLHPKFATTEPVVYSYLIRIHQKDGSHIDVWVDPDVDKGRFFYNVNLSKIDVD